MDIYIDRSIRDARTPVTFSSLSSGMAKIAKVSENCATAIILSAVDSIQQGDRIQAHTATGRRSAVTSSLETSAPEDAEAQPPPESSESELQYDLSE